MKKTVKAHPLIIAASPTDAANSMDRVKVFVTAHDRKLMLAGEGGDPNIVLEDRVAGENQRQSSAMIFSNIPVPSGRSALPGATGNLRLTTHDDTRTKGTAMSVSFSGLGLHLGNLSRISNAESRSCSAENPTGAKGQGGRYLPNQDEIASTAFWYQTEPHTPFPQLPERDRLEII